MPPPSAEPDRAPPPSSYLGLFAVAMATLMFEILLTRIFSATTWYHFAFMAVSVAMFGMTAGALAVYLRPETFTAHSAQWRMAQSSLAFAFAIPLCFLAHLSIPFDETASVVGLFSNALTYAVLSVPFFFSGIAVCVALTRFPARVGSLYAADLAGAGFGCAVLLQTLRLGDAPSAVLVVAALAALGGLGFARASGRRPTLRGAAGACVLLLGLAGLHAFLAQRGEPPIRLVWVKGAREKPPLYERWNSFSRITVTGGGQATEPFGWGLSSRNPHRERLHQLSLYIDGAALTVVTEFDGDPEALAHLRWDVTNFAHHLRPDARVAVIGSGGGRDLLAALVFDQRQVTGIEMNRDLLETVHGELGAFSGHLDRHPKVRIVNDEARSFLARSDERFDLIQISLIDTWAATTAGAFVLAENALYTVEAWQIFLERLAPGGLLTLSRWYLPQQPSELYRTASLAAASLRERGALHPERHMALVASAHVANLMVGAEPLSPGDLEAVGREAGRLGFRVLLAGGEGPDPALEALARGEAVERLPSGLRLDLSAPTDDRPFFFNMLRLQDLFHPSVHESGLEPNLRAVQILGWLLVVVLVLCGACIALPLWLRGRREALRGAGPWLVFFASIGLGFMLIELSQMHRLVLLLGHPVYGLSVVLFALLLSSGAGSLWSQRFADPRRAGPRALGVLLGVLALFGLGVPALSGIVQGWTSWARIGAATAVLVPLGLALGMAFPLGLRLASRASPELTPWLWGINGASSVLASVIATGVSLSFGISAAYWSGAACYVLALLAFLRAAARQPSALA